MTLNRYITVADVMATGPCYSEEKVIELFYGRKRVRLSTVLNSKISPDDKIWLVSKFLPDDTNRTFARWCALQVVHLWGCPDIVRKYLVTGDDGVRAAASDAVSDTAWYTLHAAWAGASAAQIEKLKEMMNQ